MRLTESDTEIGLNSIILYSKCLRISVSVCPFTTTKSPLKSSFLDNSCFSALAPVQ